MTAKQSRAGTAIEFRCCRKVEKPMSAQSAENVKPPNEKSSDPRTMKSKSVQDVTEQSQGVARGSLRRMVQWLRRKCCRHQFALCDQQLTGIQEQERPAPNASYAEWMQWYRNRDKDPAHTKRVSWPCVKCGEVFYAHCGLDILRHGTIKPLNNTICDTGNTERRS